MWPAPTSSCRWLHSPLLVLALLAARPRVAAPQLLRVVGSGAIQWRTEYELVRVEAYGVDSARVRFTNARTPISSSLLGAILPVPELPPGRPGARTVAAEAVLGGSNCTVMPGIDLQDNDLSARPVIAASAAECCSVCWQDPECVAWTFETTHCWRKSSASGKAKSAGVPYTSGVCVGRHGPEPTSGTITNGNLRVVVAKETACCSAQPVSNMKISFFNTDDGRLLTEEWYPLHGVPARMMRPLARSSGGLFEATYSLAAQDGEQFFGLGQRQHGRLGQRGMVLDFDQFNTEVSVPHMVSSRGYGLLWSVPARGRVELATNNRTRFFAAATRQVDYLVTTGATTMDIMARYAEATGHAPPWPRYASGFWQCKNRYVTQHEVLNVTREFKARNLPLSVIVIDDDPAFSPHAGDWRLNPTDWPDPTAMVREILGDGYQVMISVWPMLEPASENFGPMHDAGLLTFAETGGCDPARQGGLGWTTYDPFNPDSRRYFTDRVMENHKDIGINAFWFDADEGSGGIGEATPFPRVDSVFSAGSLDEVGMMYAWHHQRGMHDALVQRGALDPANGTGVLTVGRSGWAGSQRWGGAIWSGDILATWASLNLQLRAGLNVQLSGIVWWTFDTGGYSGLNVDDPRDQELYVRWLQWAGFVPIMRTHGDRRCTKPHPGFQNCPNEPWSFGAANAPIINRTLWARERLRPYIDSEMARASSHGRPIMRPLFVDFPKDTASWGVESAYMFGDALLVAPVLAPGLAAVQVYLPPLPAGSARWRSYWDRSQLFGVGGRTETVQVTMDRIPVFVRDDVAAAKLLPQHAVLSW